MTWENVGCLRDAHMGFYIPHLKSACLHMSLQAIDEGCPCGHVTDSQHFLSVYEFLCLPDGSLRCFRHA